MAHRKVCISGDLAYLERLVEMYGMNTKIRTVWEKEKQRVAIEQLMMEIPPLDIQEKAIRFSAQAEPKD